MIGAHNGPFRKNRDIAQAGLDFDFRANLYQQIDTDGTDMARTSTFTDLVTVSRASKKTNAGGWDFTNGGTVGTLTEVNNNEPALDGTKGLLIEETSTNEIRNPRCEGGSGATLPTNWSVVPSGTTMTVQGSGDEDGWPYVDIEVTGTATGSFSINFETPGAVASGNGVDWSQSIGLRLVSGDLTNAGTPRIVLRQRDAGLGGLSELAESVAIDSISRRFALSGATNEATVAFVQPTFKWAGASGAVQFVVRIYAPQLEEKAYPTSPILPPVGTPGASTRAVDATQLSLGAWFDTSAVSVCMNVIPAGDPIGIQAYFSNNTFNERIQLRRENTTRVRLGVWTGGVQGGDAQITSATPVVTGAVYKYAFAVAANDMALSIGGETQATDSSVTMPTGMVDLQFGSDHSAALPSNGWIQDFRYFPERLTDAQLESLVGN